MIRIELRALWEIEGTKPFFEIRPGIRFFELISIFTPMGLYNMDQNWNKLEKACSRSNFEERFGAIDFLEPREFNLRGHAIQKKIENFVMMPQNWNFEKMDEFASKTAYVTTREMKISEKLLDEFSMICQ